MLIRWNRTGQDRIHVLNKWNGTEKIVVLSHPASFNGTRSIPLKELLKHQLHTKIIHNAPDRASHDVHKTLLRMTSCSNSQRLSLSRSNIRRISGGSILIILSSTQYYIVFRLVDTIYIMHYVEFSWGG